MKLNANTRKVAAAVAPASLPAGANSVTADLLVRVGDRFYALLNDTDKPVPNPVKGTLVEVRLPESAQIGAEQYEQLLAKMREAAKGSGGGVQGRLVGDKATKAPAYLIALNATVRGHFVSPHAKAPNSPVWPRQAAAKYLFMERLLALGNDGKLDGFESRRAKTAIDIFRHRYPDIPFYTPGLATDPQFGLPDQAIADKLPVVNWQ